MVSVLKAFSPWEVCMPGHNTQSFESKQAVLFLFLTNVPVYSNMLENVPFSFSFFVTTNLKVLSKMRVLQREQSSMLLAFQQEQTAQTDESWKAEHLRNSPHIC